MNSCKVKLELVKEFLWKSDNTVESIVLIQRKDS